MGSLGGPNVWTVSADERAKHDQQFFALKPQNGFVTGEQARGFFMQSGLPSNVLAQIWSLADLNKDGKMDKKEFSIAMHLIQKKLQGFGLPAALPDSMKIDPQPSIGTFGPGQGQQQQQPNMGASTMSPGMMSPAAGMMAGGTWPRMGAPMGASPAPMGMQPMGGGMGMGMQPGAGMGMQPMAGAGYGMAPMPTAQSPAGRRGSNTDWSMPQPTKLKYSQMFNNLDKNRVGALMGVHARNILSQAGLPNPILAQIWTLSDLDKDGRLSCDEFCIAMHLVDMAKSGITLPATVPAELVPASRQRTLSTGEPVPAEELDEEGKSVKSLHSFEDKRKENFDKGQAELDRRRQILLDQERREKEKRDQKEREEWEKRERERLEMERRRQLEMEKQLARQREIEMQRQEEQRKVMEQREAARREMERQRHIEWEKQKLQDLTHQRQREQEAMCHSKQTQKNLSFQLQALGEKSSELNQQIGEMRERIVTITGHIENMKKDRDSKLTNIEQFRREVQDCQMRLGTLGREKQDVLGQKRAVSGTFNVSDTYNQVLHSYKNKEMNMEKLKESLAEIEKEMKLKQTVTDERKSHFTTLEQELNQVQNENKELYEKLVAKQHEAREKLLKYKADTVVQSPVQNGIPSNQDAWGGGASMGAAPVSSGFADAFGNDSNWSATATSEGAADWAASDAWGQTAAATAGAAGHVPPQQPTTVRYRALHEFVARGADELSFQPGDTILVFRDHPAEQGWLAGQIRDKVGWFPEAFAECLEGDSGPAHDSAFAPAIPETAPAMQKLPSIHEESFERDEHGDQVPSSFSQKVQKLQEKIGSPTQEEPKGLVAQALYPWKAKKDDHLSFQKGDLIKILEQKEMWWEGELNGKRGFFPKSYVKLVDGPRRRQSGSQGSQAGSRSQSPGNELDEKPKTPDEDYASSTPAAAATTDEGEWYVSMYAFVGPESGDLNFDAGQRIFVTKTDGDWWQGIVDGRTGIFPALYVQKESAIAAAAATSSPQHQNGNGVHETPAAPTAAAPTAAAAPAPALASPTADEEAEIGKVIAPFQGGASNQLTLQAGDLIRIRTKSPTGWWEGELQKKGQDRRVGWFPGNYVKILGKTSSKTPRESVSSVHSVMSGGGGRKTPAQEQQGKEQVEAIFDYVAQQEDELSFSSGDLITIVEKVDADWWKGALANGSQGLFPANYVQPPTNSSASLHEQDDRRESAAGSESRKLSMHKQELTDTEQHYIKDLEMIRDEFRIPCQNAGVLNSAEIGTLFGNWDQLILVARKFHTDLKQHPNGLGQVILNHAVAFKAFATFCQGQQAALELLEHKEKMSPDFRAVYTRCCQSPAARGLPLSYFLLLPLTRVTKYPLIVEKLIKYSDANDVDRPNLEKALLALKELCTEVNHVVTEVENLQMLLWCQTHIRADAIRPTLLFHSQTKLMGPRKYLHSGILFKSKSNRLLIGLLFNDFLMLMTPDEQIDHPDSFKLSKASDLTLNLYKTPIFLYKSNLQLPPVSTGSNSEDEARLLALNIGDEVVSFKAINSNARTLWVRQLEKAIRQAKEALQTEAVEGKPPSRGLGRLLIELVCVRQLTPPSEFGPNPSVLGKLYLGNQKQTKQLDLSKRDGLCTTQFVIETQTGVFRLGLYLERFYAPDLCAGIVELPLTELIQSSGSHRGPILRQLPLTGSEMDGGGTGEKSFVIIKFVVQLFDR